MRRFSLFLFLCCLFTVATQAQVTKRVLVEKFTAASCGNCPDGTARLLNIAEGDPNVIWVSHHAGWLTDPMLFPEIDTIADAFTDAAPKAAFDRVRFSGESAVAANRPNWQNHVNTQLALAADVDIMASGLYNSTTKMANLTVDATFINSVTANGEYRFNVFVVEDSLIGSTNAYNQSNYFNNTMGHYYQGAGNPIQNYPHRYVTRAVPSTAWGNGGVIPNTPMMNTTYSMDYAFQVPNDYNEATLRFVVFITDYSSDVNNREVLNAFELKLSELQVVTATNNLSTVFNQIQVAPNPVENTTVLTIDSDEAQDLILTVFDAMGRKVLADEQWTIQSGQHQKALNLEALNTGLYFLQISNGTMINTQRILKK